MTAENLKKPNHMSEVSETRRQAWETRRQKYGPRGHARGAYRTVHNGPCAGCQTMRDTILRLHNEAVLSEGQAAKALNVDRVELRTLAQAHPSFSGGL